MGRGGNRDGATTRLISLVGLAAISAVLGASCSTSAPTSALKQPKTPHVSAPSSTATTISRSTTITGVYGNGSSITGDSGPGTNTGQGLVLPGATSTTVVGGVSTTITPSNPDIAALPTTGVTPTTAARYRITKGGRKVLIRHLSPIISKFRPPSSPVGATVIIVGKRLQHATAVAFDGIRATITLNTATRIRVVVPAGATSGPISVVTTSGSATVSGFVVD